MTLELALLVLHLYSTLFNEIEILIKLIPLKKL